MRRILFALLLISTAAYGAGSHHVILTPAHPLTDAERAGLTARGIEIKEAVGGGRVLLRIPPGATLDEALGSVEALTSEKKIHRGALREAARGKALARINVIFHDDVPFEVARDAIAGVGGAIDNPLQLAFDFPSRIRARIPPAALRRLASDERVLLVYGPLRLPQTSDNRVSAQVSRVDVVQAPPYNLSGSGVVMSYFELAKAEEMHREFEGRLITHFTGGSSENISHATHTAGTMIAAGIDPAAKGMAPRATLHEFSANDGGDFANIVTRKKELTGFGSIVDNNSWSYILGWCEPGKCRDSRGNVVNTWEWEDTAELYGSYEFTYTAGLDQVAKTSPVLMIHSAGNDAEKTGPFLAPFSHRHDGDDTNTYCYSANGSGTDCPSPCTVGAKFCEITRHAQLSPSSNPPFTSVGITASAKNVLAVGAVDSEKNIASFSSRGPMLDGRIKPEVVARGVNVWSSNSGGGYILKNGTSMSGPVVAGIAALLTEEWRMMFAGDNPTPIILKTVIIAGAEDRGNAGPDYTYGFGLADAKASVDLVIADNAQGRRIQTGTVAQGAQVEYPLSTTTAQKLRVVLGWVDPEVLIFPDDGLATTALVNDVDLKVIDPTGSTVLPYVLDKANPNALATRGVNTVDNTEMVEIANAVPGIYRIVVSGTRITTASPQTFVVVANGDMPAICRDETNNSESSAFNLISGRGMEGTSCDVADADYFRFVTNKGGTVSVAVRATDTPLRATLTSSATTPVTATVAPNTTETLTTQIATSAATTFVVKIEVAGTVGSAATYTVTPTYPFTSPSRRRAVGR